MRGARKTNRRLCSSRAALVWVGVFFAAAVFGAEVEVDAALSEPVRRGGLRIETMKDIQALGRDTSLVIACWVAGAESFTKLSRSGADYSVGVNGGTWRVRGGPMGGASLGRLYDGSSDFDTVRLAVEDSLDWRDGFMLEILFRAERTGAAQRVFNKLSGSLYGYLLYLTPSGALQGSVYNGSLHASAFASGPFDDGGYHLLRMVGTKNSVMVMVDGGQPVVTNFSETSLASNAAAAFGGGSFLLSGSVAYLMMYDAEPGEKVRDALWNLLQPHLDGSRAFAAIQPALDYLSAEHDGDGVFHTVSIARGAYNEPVNLPLDSVTLVGRGPELTRIIGTGLPAGMDLVTVEGPAAVTLSGLRVESPPRYGVYVHGGGAAFRAVRCLFTGGNPVNLLLAARSPGDSASIEYCTIAGGQGGVYSTVLDSGAVAVISSIITGASSDGVKMLGRGNLYDLYNLYWANGTDVTGVYQHLPPRCASPADPRFIAANRGDYGLCAHSPARYGSPGWKPLGALPVVLAPPIPWGRPGWGRVAFGARDPFTNR